MDRYFCCRNGQMVDWLRREGASCWLLGPVL